MKAVAAMTAAIIGRAYCPKCKVIRAYVKDATITAPLKCPTCDVDTVPASGDEA